MKSYIPIPSYLRQSLQEYDAWGLFHQQPFRTHYMLQTRVVTGAKGTFSAFKGPGVRGAEVNVVMQKGQLTGKRGGTGTTLRGILKRKSSIQA